MANTGLKPYTKQFEENIDNGAKMYVNLYSIDANTIVELPIFTTFCERQLELKLYFNYQDRNVLGFFGKGAGVNIGMKSTNKIANGLFEAEKDLIGVGIESLASSIPDLIYNLF